MIRRTGWALLLALLPASLHAQRVVRADPFAPEQSQEATSTQGVAFVASALLPGAGQFYLKSDKWVPFVAVEAWAWLKYAQNHRRATRLERQYRDIAWNVARRITTSARQDSAFTYYEAMGQWRMSGLYDADPQTDGLQPEANEETFNGMQWARARAIFLGGASNPAPGTPQYEQALAFYRANAIPDTYVWNWGNSALEQQEFRETISASDEAFRHATTMMGVILANHVVSAVDALVMARVRMLSEHRIRIGSTLEPGSSSYLWTTTVRIPLTGAKRDGHARNDP